MIDGVRIKNLKSIPDERGFLMELLRCDEEVFERFGQVYITGCTKGVAKAWHYHKEQTDHFVCVWGKALVVLYDMRTESPTVGKTQEVVLEAPPPSSEKAGRTPLLVKIPPLVTHGFTALDCDEARIINIPTIPYRYENPDEFRFPWNSPEIPYAWPPGVKKGG